MLPNRSARRGHAVLCGCALVFICFTGEADAHAMDYGSLEAIFGEPVTTSVSGSPQRASDVPASMIIITQDDIRRSGARDISGVLRHVPGLSVMQWTNDFADVAVRGYDKPLQSRLLVLVDGRQVYADDYGFTPWSTIPVELADIRQIEVVFGPNSALFGFNAVAGVINIITYNPQYDDVNTVSATVGTQSLVQGSGVVTHRWGDDAAIRISLGGRSNDDFATPLPPIDIGTRLGDYRRAIDVLGVARLGDGINASLDFSHSEAAEPEYLYLGFTSYLKYRITSVKGDISADTDIGLIDATAYMNRLDIDVTSTVTPKFPVKNAVYVVQVQDIIKPAPEHTVRLSFEYRHNAVDTTPIPGGRVFYDVYAGSAMWNWTIEPELALTNAARVDYLSLGRDGSLPPGYVLTNADWNARSITALSFNSGLVWQPDDPDTVRLTVARGVQLPNLLDFGGSQIPLPLGGFAAGIPTIEPTVVMNYGLDWDRDLPDWNAKFHLRAYHQTSQDIGAPQGGTFLPAQPAVTPTNIGNSEATGAEISIEGTFLDGWRWNLGYTPEVITDHFRPGFNAVTVFTDFAHTHPVHIVDAHLGWSDASWEVDGYGRYESSFDGIQIANIIIGTAQLARIPNYVTFDARVAYHLTDTVTLSLSGRNLFQSPQLQTSGPAVERSVEFAVSADF